MSSVPVAGRSYTLDASSDSNGQIRLDGASVGYTEGDGQRDAGWSGVSGQATFQMAGPVYQYTIAGAVMNGAWGNGSSFRMDACGCQVATSP